MSRYPWLPVASGIEGNLWPAIPPRKGAQLLALLHQLEQSQWLPPALVQSRQYGQASRLASYAARMVPFYRERLAASGIPLGRRLSPDEWRRIPLLTREDIQRSGEALASVPFPKEHGASSSTSTSGSTGKPVTVVSTTVSNVFWSAITLRDHVWHRRDVTQKFAAIRKIKGHNSRERRALKVANWGSPLCDVFASGPGCLLSINTPVEQQLAWLREEKPAYLLTYPTNLQALLDLCRKQGTAVPGLRQIRTMAEVVAPELRAQCGDVLGIGIADMYSSQECGYFALQAPGHDHYLVQAEVVLLEVLRADGSPCGAGETGRVVVTPLTNYAMPLLRYEIGDFATVGAASPCGRGLPVLERILGRVRNMLVTPDGQRIWPAFGTQTLVKVAPIRQYQFVQLDRTTIEARFVPWRPIAAEEEQALLAHVRSNMPAGMAVTIRYVGEIARSEGGKYEDFVCNVRD